MVVLKELLSTSQCPSGDQWQLEFLSSLYWDRCCLPFLSMTWTVKLSAPSASLLSALSCVMQLTHWKEGMPSRGTLTGLRGAPVWTSLFWFGLDKCKVPTKKALSLPLLNWVGETKYDERLEGRDKDRERSLTTYCHGQNRLNLGRKGSLIHHRSNQSRIVRK